MVCEDILARLKMGERIQMTKDFVVVLPLDTVHTGHPFGKLEVNVHCVSFYNIPTEANVKGC